MDEIAATTPTFAGVSYELLEEKGSVQWPCNELHPEGTPIMHVDGFMRGKGRFIVTEYVADRRADRPALPAAADHRAHPLASTTSARRRGGPTNVVWHPEDVLEIHPHDAEVRGVKEGDWVRLASPRGRDDAAGDAHRPGRRRAWSTPPSTTPTRRPT